jgi:hypothetical protein
MAKDRIVAVGLLTQRDLDALGQTFNRLWPITETSTFADLLEAIDEADKELGQESTLDDELKPDAAEA